MLPSLLGLEFSTHTPSPSSPCIHLSLKKINELKSIINKKKFQPKENDQLNYVIHKKLAQRFIILK